MEHIWLTISNEKMTVNGNDNIFSMLDVENLMFPYLVKFYQIICVYVWVLTQKNTSI